MQIILTSAKIMNAAADVAVPFVTQPAFETEANELALSIASWSVAELMQAFQCSESLAHDNQQRFQSFFNAAEKLPAILAYHAKPINICAPKRSLRRSFSRPNATFSSPLFSTVCCAP